MSYIFNLLIALDILASAILAGQPCARHRVARNLHERALPVSPNDGLIGRNF